MKPQEQLVERIWRNSEHCGHCRYYLEFTEDEQDDDEDDPDVMTGNCRRYPPILLPSIPVAVSAYPEVSATKGWCGEFVPEQ